MNGRRILSSIFAAVVVLSFGACAPRGNGVFDNDQSQLTLRQMQSRTFDTGDKNRTMRTVIQTLQDLSFAVDKADEELGSISGIKLDGYALRMTVTVFPRGEAKMVVRANAQYNITPVVDPEPYQRFFAALEKSMFLAAQEVD